MNFANYKIESKSLIYSTGLFLLLFTTSILVVSSLLFFVGVSITFFNLFLSLGISIAFFLYISSDKSVAIKSILIGSLVFIICVLISSFVYDFSWDGNFYHKTAIGLLKEGWNPIYQSAENFGNYSNVLPYINKSMLYVDHYAKATWIFGATIYTITGNIESGKAITLIEIVVAFCFIYDYLQTRFLKKWQSLIVAFLAVFNPITIPQMFSFYIDGVLGIVLIISVFAFIGISDKAYLKNKNELWLILLCSIVFCVNIKSTGLYYVGILCFAFFVFWLIKLFLENKKSASHKFFKNAIKLIIYFLVCLFVSIGIVGSSTYVKNLIQHHNPLYLVVGRDALDFSGSQPKTFENLSNPEKLLISIVSKMDHSGEKPQLKIPFTFDTAELQWADLYDLRIGGFGPLFSGIMILSILIILMGILIMFKKRIKFILITILTLSTIVMSCMLIPAAWQVRYIPHFYIIPIFALVFVFALSTKTDFKSTNIRIAFKILKNGTAILFSLVILCNILPFIKSDLYKVKDSCVTSMELKHLSGTKIKVSLYCVDFIGLYYNLKDNDIKFELGEYQKASEKARTTYRGWIKYE
jgi:hypothetical protein